MEQKEKKQDVEVIKGPEEKYNYFKNKSSLILTLVLFIIAMVVETIFLLVNIFAGSSTNLSVPGTIIGVIYIFFGWIYGNHLNYDYRRRSKNYGVMPLEIRNEIAKSRYPLMYAGLFALLGTLIFYYIDILL